MSFTRLSKFVRLFSLLVAASTGITTLSIAANAADQTPSNKKSERKPFELRDGDSIVWLGGTFIERAQRYGWLETELQTRFTDRKIRFRNLGWSGDTVLAESRGIFDPPSTGYARMLNWIKDIKPTVIMLNYGGNESFNGAAGLPTFRSSYEKLLNDLTPYNADLVLITPHYHLEMPAPLPSSESRNHNLRLYGDAVVELAQSRQLHTVDLRLLDWKDVAPASASDNGLHFNNTGNRIVAEQLTRIGFGQNANVSIRLTSVNSEATSGKLDSVKLNADSASFHWTSSSLQNGQHTKLVVEGLKEGQYSIVVDGSEVERSTAAELAKGRAVSMNNAKQAAAMDALRQKIIEKDTMFFHRWRPQNVTYLFLFRKHEQGNNAKEVEEFETIVAKLDDEIHRLKQPVAQVVEIRRTPPSKQ